MVLSKASAQAAPFKCVLYGESGTGKTTFAAMLAEGLAKRRKGRYAYIDTEFGTKYLPLPAAARLCHPEAFDFDREITKSLAVATGLVRSLDPKTHPVLVLDSLTDMWVGAREAWESANPGKDPALRDWAQIKRPYNQLLKLLWDGPHDVIVVGRQKTIFEETDGKLSNAGVGIRADSEVQYTPDFCFQMFNSGKRGDESIPMLFVEKDRSSLLHGKVFAKPTFKTIEPILAILGTEALNMGDDDERKMDDAMLMQEQESKTRDKEEKSAGIFSDLQAKIAATTDITGLGEVANEGKKLKRSLTAEHSTALNLLFKSKTDQYTSKVGV